MGVPGFYRTIFKRYLKSKHKIYKMVKSFSKANVENTENSQSPIDTNIMYFYIDFNPIIYLALLYLLKTKSFSNADELEDDLIKNIISTTQEIVNDFVRPKKMLFIAIDGPAPKCKLATQRARRYKSIFEQKIKKDLKKKYSDKQGDVGLNGFEWDRANITPGTPFMEKLDMALRKCISSSGFNCPNVIFSDSSMVSEGEHKITKHLSGLNHFPDEEICVYSNDGDMAFLAMQFPEKNILTMIDSGFLPKNVQKKCETPYVYFINKAFHKIFINDLMNDTYVPKKRLRENENIEGNVTTTTSTTTTNTTNTTNIVTDKIVENSECDIDGKSMDKKSIDGAESLIKENEDVENCEESEFDKDIECPWDVNRILMDFLCVSFLGGNDFVRALPFGEIRKAGSYMMYLRAYKKAKTRNDKEYLVSITNLNNGKKKVTLNKFFLHDVLFHLARQECKKMKDYQCYVKQEINKAPSWGPFTSWDEEWLEYQHAMYCLSGHPEHEHVRNDLSLYDKYVLVPPKETQVISSFQVNTGNTNVTAVSSMLSNVFPLNGEEGTSNISSSPHNKSSGSTSSGRTNFASTSAGRTNFVSTPNTKNAGQTALQKQNYDIVNNNMNEWKAQYYKKNFGFDPTDKKNYNFEKLKLCRTYLKSLMFTMQYYLNSSPPSWRWNYQYHVAPWPSDLLIATRNSDFELLDNFSMGQPYTSIEQLLLTVPMTSTAFPQEYRCDSIKQMLPDTQNISIDRINGDKYIYAEPKLADIDEFKLLEYARKIKLGPENKKRNQVGTSLFVFQKN